MDWFNIITNCGAVGAVIYTVMEFLKFITKRDDVLLKVHADCEAKLERITEACIRAINESISASKDLQQTVALLKESLSTR